MQTAGRWRHGGAGVALGVPRAGDESKPSYISAAAGMHEPSSRRASPWELIRFWRERGHKERHMALLSRAGNANANAWQSIQNRRRLKGSVITGAALRCAALCDSKCKSMPFMRWRARQPTPVPVVLLPDSRQRFYLRGSARVSRV